MGMIDFEGRVTIEYRVLPVVQAFLLVHNPAVSVLQQYSFHQVINLATSRPFRHDETHYSNPPQPSNPFPNWTAALR